MMMGGKGVQAFPGQGGMPNPMQPAGMMNQKGMFPGGNMGMPNAGMGMQQYPMMQMQQQIRPNMMGQPQGARPPMMG